MLSFAFIYFFGWNLLFLSNQQTDFRNNCSYEIGKTEIITNYLNEWVGKGQNINETNTKMKNIKIYASTNRFFAIKSFSSVFQSLAHRFNSNRHRDTWKYSHFYSIQNHKYSEKMQRLISYSFNWNFSLIQNTVDRKIQTTYLFSLWFFFLFSCHLLCFYSENVKSETNKRIGFHWISWFSKINKNVLKWFCFLCLFSGFSAVIPGFPRYSVLGDRQQGVYNLRITNASLEDDAEYQCQVGPARLNSAIRANAKLTVICK